MEQIERLYDCKEPISEVRREEFREQLENMQGNILKGHGRNNSVCVFLRFKTGKETTVRAWIKALADNQRITSAQKQLDEIEEHRNDPTQPGNMFGSFFLSAKGYEYLGITLNGNVSFGSMKQVRHKLNDPVIDKWEQGYQKAIHAMVLLADNDDNDPRLQKDSRLQKEKEKLCDEVKDILDDGFPFCEYGRVICNKQKKPVEHFGYVDNRSQPLFFERDITRRESGRTDVWNPGAGPNLVLVPDLHQGSKAYSGSYLVFRKLQQDVYGFKDREKRLAQELGFTGKKKERAEALIMGRFRDGTPLALSPLAIQSNSNNFSYDDDPHGGKCPLQAHIRKVNPRTKNPHQSLPHIVRRGITYGNRKDIETLPPKGEGVGLLFMCYQNNITNHFEVMQSEWSNNPYKPKEQWPGIDPVIGQRASAGEQQWPMERGDAREQHRAFDFHGFVTLKGGEYFFAPSIHFLKNILSDQG
jgi:Dyp-type peroxidase family